MGSGISFAVGNSFYSRFEGNRIAFIVETFFLLHFISKISVFIKFKCTQVHIGTKCCQSLNMVKEIKMHTCRDAGAMVGQEDRRGTQGHSRPMTREANRRLGGSGVLPR